MIQANDKGGVMNKAMSDNKLKNDHSISFTKHVKPKILDILKSSNRGFTQHAVLGESSEQ